MGVGKRIFHPRRPKTACYGLPRRKKKPKHPKTLLNHSARNEFWRLQVAARRSNTAPRPIRATPTVGAPSGACGPTTYAVISPPPWHLGPECGAFWPRASILYLKSGAQSNQALVLVHTCSSCYGGRSGRVFGTLRYPHLILPYLAYYDHIASQCGGHWCSPIPRWCNHKHLQVPGPPFYVNMGGLPVRSVLTMGGPHTKPPPYDFLNLYGACLQAPRTTKMK
jgi:hypothetical protein